MPFLGFVVNTEKGISIDISKCKAIMALVPPRTITEMKGLLGSCSFLEKFIPDYAALTTLWQELIKGKKK